MDDFVLFDDLGPSKPPPASVYEDMFDSYFNRAAEAPEPSPKASSSPSTPPPVFDKPVFDDDPDTADPFDAIPLFGGGGGGEGEDVLGGSAAKPERRESEMVGFDEDLFPGLGGSTKSTEGPVREVERDGQAVGFDDDLIPGLDGSMKPAPQMEPETVGFDDGVIPGFGGRPSHHYSAREEPIMGQESESISSSKMSVSMTEDPFVILGGTHKSGYSSFGLFSDPLDNIGMPLKAGNTKVDAPDNTSGMFQSSDMFTEVPKAMPSFLFTSENQSDKTERRSAKAINSMSHSDRVPQEKPVQQASTEAPDNTLPAVNFPEASVIHEVPVTTGIRTLNPFAGEDDVLEAIQSSEMPNDMWLTVSDIVLVTQPTSAPPPSRPPPPLAAKKPPTESVSSETYARHRYQGYHHSVGSANTSKTSQIDDLEDFFTAKPANFANPRVLKDEGNRQYPSIATASFMDWTETGHSKEGNQAFDSMFTSSQNGEPEIDEKAEVCAHEMEPSDEQERLENERIQREHEEEERRAERKREEEFERERENVRQREQEEQRRREKERETRQAVDKAVREARERAAAEARKRAERAAVQKAAAEARERAAVEARERAAKAAAEAKEREAAEAMERAGAESRERDAKAAAEARERVDRAAAEAREKAAAESQEKAAAEARATAERAAVEKAAAEARRRAERAAFERVAAEARQRAANVARERAAAEARQRAANEARERAAAEARARENQQRRATAEPDLESFFGIPSRSSSVPRSYTATTNPFDVQPHGKADSGAARTSGSASPFTQPSSSNLMDDLSSVFGAPSSAVFQEVNGESEERRKARLERHQRTMERAAKALAEKNERDLQAQREQEERHRIGESLDFEIKRWAAGKEGNLRALLSTLQYILWPECGWRPVSLTDLITAASVKKEYRKATLCIHPDKVQQKGANLQQKYIAEKVFDLLKEAWNKFNSEELF